MVRCDLLYRGDERLIGEPFVLDSRGRTLKRPVGVQVSHHSINRDVENVGVLWRPSGSAFWQSAECSPVRLGGAAHGVYGHLITRHLITRQLITDT